jgi:tRNA uridine 5-carboxymethylaminomethyl modification enzyme
MKNRVLQQPNLEVFEDEAIDIIVKKRICRGIVTKSGKKIASSAVILTTGTFLNGLIHIGLRHFSGGRFGEKACKELSKNLRKYGFKVNRLKTGTTPRLDGKTIDFSVLKAQKGDKEVIPFSFSTKTLQQRQVPCYITQTNKKTHKIIKDNLDRSPLYAGIIKSTGVRYCPSIEDKVVRFSEKDSHQIFLEPEGLNTDEYYPNGISTSLPEDVQEDFVCSIKGLENVKINRPGYGIEYDFIDPTELYPTLESKKIIGLYMAGQINGTTGYEEAASLGLMAAINAALKIKGQSPLVLKRSEAYLGVLIDDLVTKGTNEPYRMFTSRVEHRLLIREDNADMRLMRIGKDLGLVSKESYLCMMEKQRKVEAEKSKLESTVVRPSERINDSLSKIKASPISNPTKLSQILRRSNVSYEDLLGLNEKLNPLAYYEKVQLEIDIKYEGYIKRELANVKKLEKIDAVKIPDNFSYSSVNGLSNEIKEKLEHFRPYSLGQAARISGVTPVAISLLMVKLHK